MPPKRLASGFDAALPERDPARPAARLRELLDTALSERGELLLFPSRENLDEAAQLELSRRLQRVIETQRDIAAADLDLDAIMTLICERTMELTGAEGALVLLPGDGVLLHGAGAGALAVDAGPLPMESMSGWAFLNDQSVLSNDVQSDERTHIPAAQDRGTRSGIVVPLRHGDRPIGVLQVMSTQLEAFSEDDLRTLDLLSVVLSASMSHAGEFEAKRAEIEALARFEAIYRDSPMGIGILNLREDGPRWLGLNERMKEIRGYTADELSSMEPEEYIHPDDVHFLRDAYLQLQSGEIEVERYTIRQYRKDGALVWTDTATSMVRDADGDPLFAIVMAQDVTQRTLAERALERNTERLARIVETQRDIAAAGLDLDAVMRLMAERAQALTGAAGAAVNLIEGNDVVTRAATGLATRTFGVRRPLESSSTGFVIETGQTLLVEDAQTDQRLNPELVALTGERSHICVPLFHGSRGIGALTVMSDSDERRLNEDDRQTMELLTVVLSSALSRAAEFEAKRQQVEALARFETTYQGAPIGIAMIDLRGHAIESNPALQTILGYSSGELARLHVAELAHPDDAPRLREIFTDLCRGKRDSYRFEERFVRQDGKTVWANVSASLVRDPDGRPRFIVGMVEDITKRKAAEEAFLRQAELNEHQAHHDALTGLANRVLFRDRIEKTLQTAARDGSPVAVLMMDLDRFKEVNDSLGHHAGDTLLKELGVRLQKVLRTSDSVARLGGDEFGLLLPKPSSTEDIVRVIERIRVAVEEPIVVQGLPLAVEASIGVSLYPAHGEDVDMLLQRADVAMYVAKEENSGYAFYDEALDNYDPTRLTLVGELRRAIEQRELELYYQPKASLLTGEVSSVEALLRWEHPQRGLVFPDDFVPVAQQTSLIKPLTLYVVARALEQCRAWEEAGTPLAVAVNLSTRNLLDTEFPDQVELLLDRWQIDPSRLEFEITESTMLADPARTRVVLERLSSMGIRLSIDDFGTGYSSLAYLKRLPVHEIKIDGSFVIGMCANEDDATIVRSTIDLGRNLGLDVVAEGVETEETWQRLRELGCTAAQGFYLSPGIPAAELDDWLRQRRG